MSDITSVTREELLRAVLRNPKDDVVRRAYADFVMGEGDAPLSQFIDVQLSLEEYRRGQAFTAEQFRELQRVERDLFRGQYPLEQGGMYHTCRWLFGWMVGGRDIWGQTKDGRHYLMIYPQIGEPEFVHLHSPIRVEFSRGFATKVTGTTQVLMGQRSGRDRSVLSQLLTAHPIEYVELNDKQPDQVTNGDGTPYLCLWHKWDGLQEHDQIRNASALPVDLWRNLEDWLTLQLRSREPRPNNTTAKTYRKADEARDSLSRAALKTAREENERLEQGDADDL